MGSLPFVGRDAALTELAAAVTAGEHVLLRGPPGIGKSRLVEETLRVARSTGLSDAGRHVDRLLASASTSGRALSTLAPLLPTGAAGGDLAAVLATLSRRWRQLARAGEAPLVWLDDAHHADAMSAVVLRYATSPGDVQLLATRRDTDPLPDDVEALLREGTLRVVDVGPLRDGDVVRIATAAAGRPLDTDRAARVVDLAGGNPLFARELALAAAGVGEPWGGLDDLVGHQVAALPPHQRRVLELVAAAEPTPAALLAGDEESVADWSVAAGRPPPPTVALEAARLDALRPPEQP
ncbi:ATP-binding protein [Aquipuribacter nitratireducens]|uniref:AAA family ATPase n=1 Tax=Aquipuribacter nitratireducens TaxID=650104 RepID=A0ABW0GNY4_9MICO